MLTNSISNRRLAGIRFEDRTPAAPTLLPRMDIAVFVGFAAAGPLHTPVALENPARFEDVFGPELALARDPTRGVTRRAHLSATVRAFFANGGRRCWVVRVADEVRAERARLGLPAVLSVSANGELLPAMAVARSAGAWFDGLLVRASLSVRSVELSHPLSAEQDALSLLGTSEGRLAFSGAALRDIRVGDLIRLRSFGAGKAGWTGFAPLAPRDTPSDKTQSLPDVTQARFRADRVKWFVDASAPEAATSSDVMATLFSAKDATPDAAGTWTEIARSGTILSWPERGVSGSRAQLVLELEPIAASQALVGQWLRLAHVSGVLWLRVRTAYDSARTGTAIVHIEGDAWREARPPNELLDDRQAWSAEIVSLDLQARDTDREPRQLTGLGFCPSHTLPWASLPTDEQHFLQDDKPVAQSAQALALLVDSPRFSVASSTAAAAAHADDWFVPLGLDTLGVVGRTWYSERTALEREGLSTFGPELFLHESLADMSVDALANQAEFIRLGLGEGATAVPLRGLHAAWPIDEASLIAVPDAHHTGWDRGAAPHAAEPQALPALQRPSFVFDDCCHRVPQTPALSVAIPPDANGTFTLRWVHGGEPSVCFVLEEASLADWSDVGVLWIGSPKPGAASGSRMEHVVRGRALGALDARYYRVFAVVPFVSCPDDDSGVSVEAVRAWLAQSGRSSSTREQPGDAGCVFGHFERSDWSNGVVVSISVAPDWEELAPRSYDSRTWLAVSRALVRFCAARGDAMALLALAGHARDDEALALQAELLSASGTAVDVGLTGSSLPLGLRESGAWGYAALYHPWLTESGQDGSLLSVPPLGAVAGTYAACAIERGAWIAPANRALRSIIALSPAIQAGRRQEFLDRQLNLVRSEPTGYLVLSQDTLAFDLEAVASAVRPVNVRRLLILLRRLVLRLGEPLVFEPNGGNLRIRVRQTFESVLAGLQSRGAFAGRTASESYRVECNDELNPPYSIDAGRLIAQIKVAPSRPMAFLTIRLVQTGERGQVAEIL